MLFSCIGGPGKYFASNTFFDTTRANIDYTHAAAHDLFVSEGHNPTCLLPFKGDMDIGKFERFIEEKGVTNIPLVMMTITKNSGGGQLVSLQNIHEASAVCHKHGVKFFFDGCRFAENECVVYQDAGAGSGGSRRQGYSARDRQLRGRDDDECQEGSDGKYVPRMTMKRL